MVFISDSIMKSLLSKMNSNHQELLQTVKRQSAKQIVAMEAISKIIRTDIAEDIAIFPVTSIEHLDEVEEKLLDRAFQLQAVIKH